uniref:Transmembrane protein 238 like n=1 Tax=Monopterus albus TaxID=43700 RepID=A0A3Q3KHT3_MONAL
MGSIKCIGECLPAFLLAVLFDCFGLILLFIGLFANLRLNNSFYGDFLIYSGSLFIFLSLAFWVMWYAGNIPVSEDYGLKKKRSGIVGQLARKLSVHFVHHSNTPLSFLILNQHSRHH